jgi:hypothetical protein
VNTAPTAATLQNGAPRARRSLRRKRDGEHGGDRRHGEDEPHAAAQRAQQEDAEQRPGEGADGVERLAQSVGGAAHRGGRHVGDEGVARSTPDALADPVEEARAEHLERGDREGEDGLRQRGEAVAQYREQLASAEPVAQRAREDARDRAGAFGDPLDHADQGRARAERPDQEDRQEGMDHLGRGVHEQRDEAQRPDGARHGAPAGSGVRLHDARE